MRTMPSLVVAHAKRYRHRDMVPATPANNTAAEKQLFCVSHMANGVSAMHTKSVELQLHDGHAWASAPPTHITSVVPMLDRLILPTRNYVLSVTVGLVHPPTGTLLTGGRTCGVMTRITYCVPTLPSQFRKIHCGAEAQMN